MKVLQINSCIYGSTGGIMRDLQDAIIKSGNQGIICSRKDWSKRDIVIKNTLYIGSIAEKRISRLFEYYFGKEGGYMWIGTYKLLKQIDQFQPDVIHLHNLHGSGINLKMLFMYIKKNPHIKVIWTMHDCWSFTGHCPYFDIAECNRWKTECDRCAQYHLYPASRFDNAKKMFYKKKEFFSNIPNMTMVAPSQWLADLTEESFLGQYTIRTIHNGINQDIFKPSSSHIRERYGLEGKYILLGVAAGWGERKGLYEMLKLADMLPDNMRIVLVGIGSTEKEKLGDKFVCISRTDSREELAKLYSEADIFINLTLEDNYPTVNLEALSCGTPVITYNTGGSGESVPSGCGFVVPRGDVAAFRDAVFKIYNNPIGSENILRYRELFSKEKMTSAYLALYSE